jgi:hypothetical protein
MIVTYDRQSILIVEATGHCHILFSASVRPVHWSQLCCTRGRSNSRFVFKTFQSVSIFGATTFPTMTLRRITRNITVYIT